MTDARTPRQVVVIGGGVAGALFMRHLLGQADGPLEITVLEPRSRLGAGTAYSASDRLHTTNIPACRMSIDPDDPYAFARWLVSHGDAASGHERDQYPRRWLFGDFVGQVLRDTGASRCDCRVTHERLTATGVSRDGEHLVVETSGGTLRADAVALATGNPSPSLPGPLRALETHARCIANPWLENALAQVPERARVLVVGTGLTMGDVVVALRARGHTGEIVAVSRRGRLPLRGLVEAAAPFGDFQHPARTANALLRRFRAEVRRAAAVGSTWHSVFAAARARGWILWRALPLEERRRFVRHLRPFYEVHRHVMPGPVADHLADERRRGTLAIRAARLSKVAAVDGGFEVELVPHGASGPAAARERFDFIVNCTGPAYTTLTANDPLWSSAAKAGLVRLDAVGLGIDTDDHGRAVDRQGVPAPDLFVLGTLARAAFGELTGVREISAQARLAAETLLSHWSAARQASHPQCALEAMQ